MKVGTKEVVMSPKEVAEKKLSELEVARRDNEGFQATGCLKVRFSTEVLDNSGIAAKVNVRLLITLWCGSDSREEIN